MAKLILSRDGLVLKELPLDQERFNIGRRPQNDIQIDNPAISGRHVAIITLLGDSFLEDLGSTNGTRVNGRQVKKHLLRHGDVIGIGQYHLEYVRTLPLPGDQGEPPPAVVRLLGGPQSGRVLELAKAQVSLGKAGIQVAVIHRRPEGYFIAPGEGESWPKINGRILGNREHLLAEGDLIEIAGVRMEFRFKT